MSLRRYFPFQLTKQELLSISLYCIPFIFTSVTDLTTIAQKKRNKTILQWSNFGVRKKLAFCLKNVILNSQHELNSLFYDFTLSTSFQSRFPSLETNRAGDINKSGLYDKICQATRQHPAWSSQPGQRRTHRPTWQRRRCVWEYAYSI